MHLEDKKFKICNGQSSYLPLFIVEVRRGDYNDIDIKALTHIIKHARDYMYMQYNAEMWKSRKIFNRTNFLFMMLMYDHKNNSLFSVFYK